MDKAQRHAAEEKAAQEARAQALAHLKKTGAKTYQANAAYDTFLG